jgi:hypothetical protein
VTLTSFDGLGLIEPLRLALEAENYLRPTPIQARTFPLLAAGKDLLGIAETGTGKTAAFACLLGVSPPSGASRAFLARRAHCSRRPASWRPDCQRPAPAGLPLRSLLFSGASTSITR